MPTIQMLPPIRVGVFDDVESACRAIDELRQAGFQRREINVLCSDPVISRQFVEYIDQQPAGARTTGALSRATIVYVCLAVIGIGVGLFSSLTTTLIVLCSLLGVALLATFGTIMLTRASERELSDYYDQAVVHGKLLLAVDLDDDAPPEKLLTADKVFDRFAGSHAALDRE